MTDERLCALLRAALAQEGGNSVFVNTGDAEEAENMGLVEVLGPGRVLLTEAGRKRLEQCPPEA